MHRTAAVENLGRIFRDHAHKDLLILPDGGTVTYEQFWGRAQAMARRLVEIGVAPGQRLLVQLENSEALLELYLSCAIGGFSVCPIDPTTPSRQLSALQDVLRPALTVGPAELARLREPPAAGAALDPGRGAEDEEFLIIFSSGSTGEPKGIVHTVRSLSDSAASFARLSGVGPDSIVYHHFPMFYMAGIFNMFFTPLCAGATIVIGPRFSRESMLRFWELPQRHQVNNLTLTPTMAHSLCRLYRRDEGLLQHIGKYQSVISTSSPLYSSIAERFLATFRVPLRTCYGVTEVGGTVTFQRWEDAIALQSMGGWAEGVALKAGTEAAPAEILIKTPFMAKSYLIKGQHQRIGDEEGFFHSGDLGYIKDGLLHFSGREHDLVKKGGEFVSTQMIENLALKVPLVQEVAAVAVPDEFWGARVVLFYVPHRDAGEADILPELARHFAEGLREIERPDKIIPVPWFPKTSIGKVLKRELLDKYSVGPRLR